MRRPARSKTESWRNPYVDCVLQTTSNPTCKGGYLKAAGGTPHKQLDSGRPRGQGALQPGDRQREGAKLRRPLLA